VRVNVLELLHYSRIDSHIILLMSDDLIQLQKQYLSLINHKLPERAKQGDLPVRLNHCFGRIVLDNLFGGCWYQFLSRKQPAYKQLNPSQLTAAIVLAQTMVDNPEKAQIFNQNSLRWRGKQRKDS